MTLKQTLFNKRKTKKEDVMNGEIEVMKKGNWKTRKKERKLKERKKEKKLKKTNKENKNQNMCHLKFQNRKKSLGQCDPV